uniref:Reverse transcriptase n=1 Tax=Arundo donax TaxID=35708 RepID=A0A0A9C5C5_ARUDO
MKRGAFQSLEEHFAKRLSDWTERYISSAGKEVLIKAVAHALPTYCMSIFKLTAGLSDELMRKMRLYWWGVENGKRKPH